MLKAILFLGSSFGLVYLRLKKTHGNSGLSFTSRKFLTTTPTSCSLILPTYSAPKGCRVRAFRMSTTRSETNLDGASPPPSSSPPSPSSSARKINFCQWCGGPTKHEIPDGEEKMRAICSICGKIAYENPKMARHKPLLYPCLHT